jgi:hypothetical protein
MAHKAWMSGGITTMEVYSSGSADIIEILGLEVVGLV